MLLSYKDINIRERHLLRQGTLSLAEHEIAVISGKNGAGKSLLARYLFNMLSSQNRDVVYVDQDNYSVLGRLPVSDNIFFEESSTHTGFIKAWINKHELAYLYERNPKTVSGGEKRLIGILRALASGAEIVIIDEPTNDLDYRIVDLVCELLTELKKHYTLLVITHDDRVLKIADTIFRLENKELVEVKSHAAASTETKETSQEKRQLSQILLNKIFKHQYFSVLLLVLLLPFVFLEVMEINAAQEEKLPSMPSDTVYLFIPISEYATEKTSVIEGSIPTFALAALNTTDINSQGALLDKASLLSSMSVAMFGLELEKSNNFEVTVVEYYNPADQMFSSDGSDPNGENSFISVKLKTGYSFFDFIESEEFIPLTEGNYYMSSNEILEMVAQLNSVKHLKRIITMVALSCVIALLLYVFYVLIYLRLMRRNIINVRNYGYSQKTVSKTIKKKLNNKNLFFVLIVVALAINLVLIHDKSFVAGYVPTLVALCMALVLHWTHKVLIKLRVKRMYNWRYR